MCDVLIFILFLCCLELQSQSAWLFFFSEFVSMWSKKNLLFFKPRNKSKKEKKLIYINQASIAVIEVLEINKWNISVRSIYCKTIVISKLADWNYNFLFVFYLHRKNQASSRDEVSSTCLSLSLKKLLLGLVWAHLNIKFSQYL